jgi:bis(5'-nucleosyl)-tetraphosphatase (symmetrical)
VARWAIGDIQGCLLEFDELLKQIRFSADRDQLWLTGDLVNRGPNSLGTLRRVHDLADNLVTVLGNHDLHLLALVYGPKRKPRKSDTLDDILAATDRDALLNWLLRQPLLHFDAAHDELLVHAGLVPQWSTLQACALAREVEQALQTDPVALFAGMYGDQPDQWQESLRGTERHRFVINVLTRLRACTASGRVDLKQKGPVAEITAPYMPWFEVPLRASAATRVVFGHWSALGFLQRERLLSLDTGCVWGGALTAVDLDEPNRARVSVTSRQPESRE